LKLNDIPLTIVLKRNGENEGLSSDYRHAKISELKMLVG
jgi:hypothetical protein